MTLLIVSLENSAGGQDFELDSSDAASDDTISEFERDESDELENPPSRKATVEEFLSIIDFQPDQVGTKLQTLSLFFLPFIFSCLLVRCEAPIQQLLQWRSNAQKQASATKFLALVILASM